MSHRLWQALVCCGRCKQPGVEEVNSRPIPSPLGERRVRVAACTNEKCLAVGDVKWPENWEGIVNEAHNLMYYLPEDGWEAA